jgi:hypothetical protein
LMAPILLTAAWYWQGPITYSVHLSEIATLCAHFSVDLGQPYA